MRKRIFDVIEVSDGTDRLSSIYDSIMLISIILSLIPLAFKGTFLCFQIVDKLCVSVFILDYALRLLTADYKYHCHSVRSFLRYPFSLMAIIDLLSILPSITLLNNGFKVLRIFRVTRTLRVLRVFKAFRYSKSVKMISNVFRQSRDPLIAVCTLSGAYILISALIIFNVEPSSFDTFFDAIYWATVSLTTVGYGDIYPVTIPGQIIAMISSSFGIAIVALPAGIFTASFLNELENSKEDDE